MRRFSAIIHFEIDEDKLPTAPEGEPFAARIANRAAISAGLTDAVRLDVDNEGGDPGPITGLEIPHDSIHEWDDEHGGVVVYQP